MDIISSIFGGIGHALSVGLVYTFIAPIASALSFFFGYLLIIASTIFEAILEYTVVSFGDTLQNYGILDGIQLVWSAFRDLSNIVIIGMFVFVAISMIIGNLTYGTKQWVAKILIVAVLMNFSLLFTELIVDASQLAATQFYRGVLAVTRNDSTAGNASGQQASVAAAFLNKMGISSVRDTYGIVAKAGTNEGLAIAVFYSLMITVVLIATAAVFLYGAYLLIARALILIVLLATSSLAFAALLVPKYGQGKYGWDGWRDALIQNVILAPLLMMFLWASIVILSKAQPGSIGSFLQNPTGGSSAASSIIVYLFTVGMLYLSIKISSSFASKIMGFNLAGQIANWPFMTGGQWATRGSRWALNQLGRAMQARVDARQESGEPRQPLTTSVGLRHALERFGAGALRNANKALGNASMSPGRLPKALDEVLAKRFGGDMGKGGIAAADKRANAANKKASEEASKNLGVVMQQESTLSKEEISKISSTAAQQEKESREKLAFDTNRTLREVAERENETSEGIKEQLKQIAMQQEQLKEMKEDRGAAQFVQQQEKNLAVQKKKLDLELEEGAKRVATAQTTAQKAALATKDVVDIQRAADIRAQKLMSEASDQKGEEYLQKILTEPAARARLRRNLEKRRKKEERREAWNDLKKEAEEGEHKTSESKPSPGKSDEKKI